MKFYLRWSFNTEWGLEILQGNLHSLWLAQIVEFRSWIISNGKQQNKIEKIIKYLLWISFFAHLNIVTF